MHKIIVFLVVFLSLVAFSQAADWPAWQNDASRSGFTTDVLPKTMSRRWTWHSTHRPQPAWPRDARMSFDRAHHVVIAHDTVYFGSSAECKVYALDADTGNVKWTFFTDGPVRFAPIVWKQSVFVVSDDGYLYCLSATD